MNADFDEIPMWGSCWGKRLTATLLGRYVEEHIPSPPSVT